jgi:hypothetical protein
VVDVSKMVFLKRNFKSKYSNMVESSLHVVSGYIFSFESRRKTVISIGYVNPCFGRLNQDITCFSRL